MLDIKRKKSSIDLIFILALFGVFIISALFIVLFGAKIYQKTISQQEENFTHRTAVAYITEKIQKNDKAGCVNIVSFDFGEALVLTEETAYGNYNTYLYLYDGYLCEVTLKADEALNKEYGAQVLDIADLKMKQDGSMFYFEVTDESDIRTEFIVSTRTKNGGTIND